MVSYFIKGTLFPAPILPFKSVILRLSSGHPSSILRSSFVFWSIFEGVFFVKQVGI